MVERKRSPCWKIHCSRSRRPTSKIPLNMYSQSIHTSAPSSTPLVSYPPHRLPASSTSQLLSHLNPTQRWTWINNNTFFAPPLHQLSRRHAVVRSVALQVLKFRDQGAHYTVNLAPPPLPVRVLTLNSRYNTAESCTGAGVRLGGGVVDGIQYGMSNNVSNDVAWLQRLVINTR